MHATGHVLAVAKQHMSTLFLNGETFSGAGRRRRYTHSHHKRGADATEGRKPDGLMAVWSGWRAIATRTKGDRRGRSRAVDRRRKNTTCLKIPTRQTDGRQAGRSKTRRGGSGVLSRHVPESGSSRALDNPLCASDEDGLGRQIKTEANIKGYTRDREQVQCIECGQRERPSCLRLRRAGLSRNKGRKYTNWHWWDKVAGRRGFSAADAARTRHARRTEIVWRRWQCAAAAADCHVFCLGIDATAASDELSRALRHAKPTKNLPFK
ncbi:hypothetical protein GWI33_005703 [Rhynchophorus ferrugineus]|uniref:Uncharacterized protein n=1 Tax=Rhynchophorus ferrugineus TaxID=354439 RepID=A0A834MJE4_RHYFE|nr:hypothetical protein GWI33_005703 [Rhynchophorus ferrugineus]